MGPYILRENSGMRNWESEKSFSHKMAGKRKNYTFLLATSAIAKNIDRNRFGKRRKFSSLAAIALNFSNFPPTKKEEEKPPLFPLSPKK